MNEEHVTGADAFSPQEAAEGQSALEVEFVQAPQDGSADTVLHLALAPSYITYNAASIKRISGFFASQKVLAALVTGLDQQAALHLQMAHGTPHQWIGRAVIHVMRPCSTL